MTEQFSEEKPKNDYKEKNGRGSLFRRVFRGALAVGTGVIIGRNFAGILSSVNDALIPDRHTAAISGFTDRNSQSDRVDALGAIIDLNEQQKSAMDEIFTEAAEISQQIRPDAERVKEIIVSAAELGIEVPRTVYEYVAWANLDVQYLETAANQEDVSTIMSRYSHGDFGTGRSPEASEEWEKQFQKDYTEFMLQFHIQQHSNDLAIGALLSGAALLEAFTAWRSRRRRNMRGARINLNTGGTETNKKVSGELVIPNQVKVVTVTSMMEQPGTAHGSGELKKQIVANRQTTEEPEIEPISDKERARQAEIAVELATHVEQEAQLKK